MRSKPTVETKVGRCKGCGGSSSVCNSDLFHRLPREPLLRKRWIVAIHHENTPEIANSYVCGQHFHSGRRQGRDDVPSNFIAVAKRLGRRKRPVLPNRQSLRELFRNLKIWNKVQRSVQKVNPATVIPHLIILLTNLGSPQK